MPTTGRPRTILTEHLRAVDANISERTATAMLYAIKSDTLFFNRQANRGDLEAFSFLYPLADAALIRKMEGAEITMERLAYVTKAHRDGQDEGTGVLRVPRRVPREDFIPYVADFFLQLEDTKWTLIAGIVNGSFVASVRNLGYTQQRRRVHAEAVSRTSAAQADTGRWPRRWFPKTNFVAKYGALKNPDSHRAAAGAGAPVPARNQRRRQEDLARNARRNRLSPR